MTKEDIEYIHKFAGSFPPAAQSISNTLHAQIVQLDELLSCDTHAITLVEFMRATQKWLEYIVARIDGADDGGSDER